MFITLPPGFPEAKFREFGLLARNSLLITGIITGNPVDLPILRLLAMTGFTNTYPADGAEMVQTHSASPVHYFQVCMPLDLPAELACTWPEVQLTLTQPMREMHGWGVPPHLYNTWNAASFLAWLAEGER